MDDTNNVKEIFGIMIAVLSGIALVAEAVQHYEDNNRSDEE